jgi:hypothetical protein
MVPMMTNTNTAAAIETAPHPFQWIRQEAFRDADVYGCLDICIAEGATSSDAVREMALRFSQVACLPTAIRFAYRNLAANCA